MDHTVYTANTPYLPSRRKRSPDGANTDSNSSHLIAACYLLLGGRKAELA